MDININFNGQSGNMDSKTEGTAEETGYAPDAGAPATDVATSVDENFDQADASAASGADGLDIGGPAEWLVAAMANVTDGDSDASDNTATDDIDDGGSGPTE